MPIAHSFFIVFYQIETDSLFLDSYELVFCWLQSTSW